MKKRIAAHRFTLYDSPPSLTFNFVELLLCLVDWLRAWPGWWWWWYRRIATKLIQQTPCLSRRLELSCEVAVLSYTGACFGHRHSLWHTVSILRWSLSWDAVSKMCVKAFRRQGNSCLFIFQLCCFKYFCKCCILIAYVQFTLIGFAGCFRVFFARQQFHAHSFFSFLCFSLSAPEPARGLNISIFPWVFNRISGSDNPIRTLCVFLVVVEHWSWIWWSLVRVGIDAQVAAWRLQSSKKVKVWDLSLEIDAPKPTRIPRGENIRVSKQGLGDTRLDRIKKSPEAWDSDLE